MNDFKRIELMESERAKFKRYCKCGHSIVFPKTSHATEVICNCCGRIIYKSDEIEFEKKLKSVIRKAK